MLSITKVNNSIKVEGLDNKQFPDNGTLMIPLNSVILTLDESNIATFRSAANNDVLFSGVITDIQIAGSTVTKQTITTAFTAIANSSGGGGGTVDAYTKAETDALLATKANESELSDYATVESLATVATSGSYDDLSNKPTIPTVPTNVSAFTNDAGYTTNTGTITGITMNGVSKGTSGVVDLGTVITDISGKQDVIDSSHKLDADLVDDTTSTNKFVTASDKTTWSGKQDALVSGTNIKTINNESILGSGNITIQGGGSSYTAGEGIDITNDVISVDIDDEKKVIASALVELHNDKADKDQLNNYQLKGDYLTNAQADTKIESYARSEAEAINVEKVDAAAFNDLDARVTALETALGGMTLVSLTQAQYEALTVKDNNTLYIITPQ